MVKKITSLVTQKRNPNRVNVFLDGEFAFGLSRITAAWLQIGLELDQGKIEELLDADQKEIAYQRALHFLSYRPRSEAEIAENLTKHEISPSITEETISRLRNAGLVDDRKFAEDWVANRTEFHPRGVRGLRYELRMKKINEQIIDEVLQPVDEESLAYRVAAPKAKQYRDLDRDRFFGKLTGLLSRRGFSSDTVYTVTRRVWEEYSRSTLES